MFSKVFPYVFGALIGATVVFVVGPRHLQNSVPTAPQMEHGVEAAEQSPALSGQPGTTNALFTWDSVESEDYNQLAANLRRIGCPEATVQDIVRARIAYAYRERSQKLCNPMAKHWSTFQESAVREQALASIRTEQTELLTSLHIPLSAQPITPGSFSQTKPFSLPPEKQKLVDEITAQYPNEKLRVGATPEEAEQCFKNRRARLEFLGQHLTAEELNNYRMAQDSGVNTVATLLRPMNLTPEELNKVAFALDFNEAKITNGHLPPEAEQVLKEGLSPERYAEYQELFSPKNAAFTKFIIVVKPSPEEIGQLRALRQQNLNAEALRNAVTQLLGDQRAAQYFGMTRGQ